MAEQDNSTGTRRFDKSLNEDNNNYHLPDNSWTHARNAINNSRTGDLGKLGNEPSNLLCAEITSIRNYPNFPINTPLTIIGTVHLYSDYWAIFSTNDFISQIGIFQEDRCIYTAVIEDTTCLNFKLTNLIKGVSRSKSTCVYGVYWDDGLNLSRTVDLDIDNIDNNFPFIPNTVPAQTNINSPIPWVQVCTDSNGNPSPWAAAPPYYNAGCIYCENTLQVDCNKLRLARLITTPCVEVKKGVSGGTLMNGSYMVAIAYAINGLKASDWYISNVQSLFDHNNIAGSIDVDLNTLDQTFDEIQVAIVYVANEQSLARLAGVYSVRQKRLSFDTIDNTWPSIPITQIPLMTPVIEKTDGMFNVLDYLVRSGTTSKEDFNYQPLANQIVTKWQSVEYPENYYRKGGNKTNYMRDEVYPFFIRWVFDTGDKSSEYHIPGRGMIPGEEIPAPTNALYEEVIAGIHYKWAVENTAIFTAVPPAPGNTLPDGGVVIGEGLMGYWESTEYYPDKKPQVWDSVNNPLGPAGFGFNTTINPYNTTTLGNLNIPLTELNLCGTPIRHHRFPDMATHPSCRYYNAANNKIRIMGIKFDNIKYPLMNDGITPVLGIVGYEIMRGVRNGNKTILAKGIICNMRTYDIPNSSIKGAFVNYPYNDLGADPFLSTSIIKPALCTPFTSAAQAAGNFNPQQNYSPSLFSFHSPDTNFKEPYLSGQELKIHGEYTGTVRGKFEKSEKHPKEKLMSNFSFVLSAIIGFGQAMMAMRGERQVNYTQPNAATLSSLGTGALSPSTLDLPALVAVKGWNSIQAPLMEGIRSPTNPLVLGNYLLGLDDSDVTGIYGIQDIVELIFNTTATLISPGIPKYVKDTVAKDGPIKAGGFMSLAGNLPMFFNYWKESTDSTLELIKALLAYRDFALRYHSHCYYSNYILPTQGNIRKSIGNSQYVGPQITSINANTRVNNLYRAKTVVIDLFNPTGAQKVNDPTTTEVTRILASNVNALYEMDTTNPSASATQLSLVDPTRFEFGPINGYQNLNRPTPNGIQTASSHYASLKQRIRNQYGQLTGVISVPASYCSYEAPGRSPLGATTSSETIFGGDTYLGRYTEKNTFFYFYNWLYDELDGAQFDYTRNEMIPYPRFWANFNGFETGDFISSLAPTVTSGFSNLVLPNSFYNLDGDECFNPFTNGLGNLRYSIKNAWFYLFNSGVKDFYVESDYNVDLRDWGETLEQQHYDPYRFTDTKSLFDTNIIKIGNYYKYDDSLSISKLFINYVSWAVTQRYNYDPYLAETCYVYKDSRVIYSLPMQYESLHDNWRDFLANNYYDFDTPVTAVKSINKSGAIFFFDSQSPLMFQGLDQLQTSLGTSLTIGDGQLFSQPQQALVNADRPYEYASCQNRMSVINTPIGPYWMSQNQGKIFNFSGGLEEISMQDMKWWLISYLPYKLTENYPDFELLDNPVIGIGCQSMFDNQNGLIYFTKKDYIVKTDLPSNTSLVYLNSNIFNVVVDDLPRFTVKLGDDRFFEDASWTISYDPKTKNWVSYHDWHPSLMMPGKNTFMTVKENKIWVHNYRTDSYCNFYDKDYPFEVEYMVDTVQTVNTVRSVEYQLECYKYAPNMFDRFNSLDTNFDEAVVYNLEQVSGLLKLNLSPRNNPHAMISYPIIHINYIDVLYSKVENKYRFNQFWDITADRGEYNVNAQRMIWNTGANGYNRTLNNNNLNYNKDSFQRKKFRHYTNTVFLRKKVSGDKKMLVVFTNNKDLYSPR